MPGKMLLIATAEQLQQVRAAVDLAPAWWMPIVPDDPLRGIANPPPWIRCGRHDLLTADSVLDARDQAELLSSLEDGTICYLAVLDRSCYAEADAESTGEPAGQAAPEPAAEANGEAATQPPGPPRTFAQHVAWYRRFRDEVRRLARSRAGYLRHVLILVCYHDPPNHLLQDFQRLVAGAGDDRLFDLSYVMLEELEPGSGPDSRFYAEYVWSDCLTGLLLKLLTEDHRPGHRATEVYAWRSYLLVPELNAEESDRFAAARLDQLRQRLFGDTSSDQSWQSARLCQFQPPPVPVKRVPVTAPADEEYAAGNWLETSAPDQLLRVQDGRWWQNRLQAAGREAGVLLGQRTIGEELPANQESEVVWRSIHQDPRLVAAALCNRDLMRGPPVADHLDTITRRWEQILEADRQRDDLIRDAQACADHLEQAKEAYVGLSWRLAAAVAVTLFVGYLAMSLCWWLTNDWAAAASVAAAAALGAVLCGLFTLDREQAAGRRGKRAMEQQFDAIDRKMLEKHEHCQEAVAEAHGFWHALRCRAAADRLRYALQRVQHVLERELQFSPQAPVDAAGADAAAEQASGPSPLADEASAATRRTRQRQFYRGANRLVQPASLADLQGGNSEQWFEEFVEDQADRFCAELWTPLCRRSDGPAAAGNVPAQLLVPALRQFRGRFQAELLNLVRFSIMRETKPNDWRKWGGQLRQILEYQQFFELVSVRLAGHQTASDAARPGPVLRLRPGVPLAVLRDAVASPRFPREVATSPPLESLPLAGFLFQQFPVQFGDGSEGCVVVAPYRDFEAVARPEEEPT